MGTEKRIVRSALVIGAGSIGQRHAQNLKRLGIIVTLFDTNPEVLTQACLDEGYIRCNDLDYALCHDQIDLALVCTPTHLHISIAQKIADAGINLFIEKPVSNTLDGVQYLIDTVKENKLCATVGFMLRFESGLKHLKSIIDPAEIAFAQVEGGSYMPWWRPGRDYRKTYSANSAMGGGAILDGVHELDYICWLLGYPNQIHGASGKFSSIEMDAEDIAMMVLTYNDKLVNVHLDYLQKRYTRRCKLCTRNGDLYEWTFGDSVREYTENGERVLCDYKQDFAVNDLYLDELTQFIMHIQNGTVPESTLQNSAEILFIALAAKYGGGSIRDYSYNPS